MEFKKKENSFLKSIRIFLLILLKKNSLRKEFNIYKIQENIIFLLKETITYLIEFL